MELEEYFRKILSNTLQPLLQEIWRGNVNQSTRELEALRRRVKESMPENTASCGWKAFSQNDEDGIIQECLRRLSLSFPLSHTFIEFCCGNGLENCTHNLLINGYRGVWLDGDPANQAFIKNGLGFLKNETLWVRDDFLTLQNIEHILKESIEFLNEKNIDVFVLDIDGNDIYFAEVIQRIIAPKLFVVEYNSKFPPPLSISIDYNESHLFQWDDYSGASLQKFVDTLTDYTLVSCNLTGINAFFIRKDLMKNFYEYDINSIYQPQRYEHVYSITHTPSFKWLKQIITKS